jgi:hypothetical protein
MKKSATKEASGNRKENRGSDQSGRKPATGFLNVVTNQEPSLTGVLNYYCCGNYVYSGAKKKILDQNEAGSRFLLAQEERPARRPRPFLPAIERGRWNRGKPRFSWLLYYGRSGDV